MKITNVAIKYRTSVLVLTAILVVAGLGTYITIPKESFPSIEIPNIIVTTIYPGASPDDIESLITQPIEQEVQSVTGIKYIRSTSTEGVSTVIVEFNPDISIDDALQKVRDKVDLAKPDLPNDSEEPIITEIDFSEFPILTLNLAAQYPLTRLKEVADNLADEIELIPSILSVDVVGALEREVQVNVDLNRLQGYNITFDDVVGTIGSENTNIPGGSVDVDRMNYLVRVDGEFEDPSEIENLVIDTPNGSPIYVRDVADVDFGFRDRVSFARLQVFQRDGEEDDELIKLPIEEARVQNVISLNIKKRSGENILETAERVNAVIDNYPLPSGTLVEITGDQSEQVEIMVADLENNIISGLFFVVAVLLFFLGIRNAFLVGIAIPLSMFISFIIFMALGYTLNFVILFSLIIALGMLVDNAVVIVENIYRFREEGHSRFDAARLGTAEVAGPVVASTATTVAAFAPMLMWPGIMGEFMSYLPLTLIVTLSSSLFVAIIINPVITGIFVRLDSEKKGPTPRIVKRLSVAAMLFMAFVVGSANWKTLVVLVLGGGFLYYSHKFVLKPIGDWFVNVGLPALIVRYRQFIGAVLHRDYSVKRAYLRNTFSLGMFTVGFALLILVFSISSIVAPAAAQILNLLAMLVFGIGALGIVFHTLETLFLGKSSTVKAGLAFAAVSVAILLLMSLFSGGLEFTTVANLLILPAIIILFGILGILFSRKPHLVLTDNRAKLITGSLGGLIAIFIMFGFASAGTELFPDTDPNMIQVAIESDLGTNIDHSNAVATEVQSRLNDLIGSDEPTHDNIKNIQTGVGVGGDIMFGGGAARPEKSVITLNMVKYAKRAESSKETMARIRERLAGIPGTTISYTKDSAGPPVGLPVNIEVGGDDFAEIVRIAKELTDSLRAASESGRIPGLVDVSNDVNAGRPELQVRIDRERAARVGLSTSDIARTIRSAVNGFEAGKYRDGEDEYDITVRLKENDRASLESLKNLTIVHEGQQIPIVSVADFDIGGGLGSITRLDLNRVATVVGDAAEGFNAQAVLMQVQAFLAPYEAALPPGYSLSYTGENEEQAEAFGFLTRALLIAVAIIFLIMVAQFNRISLPFIIMVAVGLSLIGVLLSLILTHTPFGLMTFIGVISLAGIVVNNNIVLIDYVQQLRERGLSKRQAIIDGGATRLRPVLLTALTTIIGLIPLTFGIGIDFIGLMTDFDPNIQFGSENTQFWGPMGAAIIGGLAFATFLTLVIVPALYSAFDSLSQTLSRSFSRGPKTDDAQIPVVAPAAKAVDTPHLH